MKLLRRLAGVPLLFSLPMVAIAVPINSFDNINTFDDSARGEMVFSSGNTGAINFVRLADSTDDITKRYDRFTRGGNAVSVLFGGLTNGQAVEFTDNANNDGGSIDAIRSSGNIVGGDFSFGNAGYTRPAGNGTLGSDRYLQVAPGTLYAGGLTPTPVAVVQDNNVVGLDGVLAGYGVRRIVPGFTTVELIEQRFGAITVVFPENVRVSGVAGYVGSLEDPRTVQAIAFDNLGNIIESVTNENHETINGMGLDAFELLGIETAADDEIIRAITFQQIEPDQLGFALDYLVFELAANAAPPVPAPSAAALLLLGLGGLGLRRRRRKQA